MQFISKILLLLMISFNAQGKLEEIKTKQDINNIRYISTDGRFTYFINKIGELKFSYNYEIKTVIKSEPNSNYQITSEPSETKIAIEKFDNPHRKNWFFNQAEIFLADVGKETATKIGEGINPRFHLQNKFLTFYKPLTSEIIIIDLLNKNKTFQIKLANKSNPYFIPNVFMVTPTDVVYTDINKEGFAAALLYSLYEKTFETIYKTQEDSKKLEVCILNETAIIGEFPFQLHGKGSYITKVDLYNNLKFKKSELIYTNNLADFGNIICRNDDLYFIKTTEYFSTINFKKTNVAKLNLTSNKLNILTDLDDVTQIVEMGQMILTPYRGQLLVVEGKNEILDDTIQKVRK